MSRTRVAVVACWALAIASPALASVHRYALLVGANDGGPGRQLRYAVSDAREVSSLLQRLGGVSEQDAKLVIDPDAASLRDAFTRMKERLADAAAGEATELVFYYSGHSDDQGLLLKGERVPYAQLRAALLATGASFRVTILDSCGSGSLTRMKGPVRVAPFLLDESSLVKGDAILTSSSAGEPSQESDELGGSFFTHALLSALRGGADFRRDGRVTLHEAYEFAFNATLEQTESTRGGPQHPAYELSVAGSGDVVLTDLRAASSTLVLPASARGRFYVWTVVRRLAVELEKHDDKALELALEPGEYRVVRELGDAAYEQRVQLRSSERLLLPDNPGTRVPLRTTVARGGVQPPPPHLDSRAVAPAFGRAARPNASEASMRWPPLLAVGAAGVLAGAGGLLLVVANEDAARLSGGDPSIGDPHALAAEGELFQRTGAGLIVAGAAVLGVAAYLQFQERDSARVAVMPLGTTGAAVVLQGALP